jgi:hypothetical protein
VAWSVGRSTIRRELTDVDPVPTYPRWPLALSLRSVVPKCLTSGFEQKLTQGVLRRVEAKQLLFAEGDAVTHLYRIELVPSPSRFWPTAGAKLWVLPILAIWLGWVSKASTS